MRTPDFVDLPWRVRPGLAAGLLVAAGAAAGLEWPARTTFMESSLPAAAGPVLLLLALCAGLAARGPLRLRSAAVASAFFVTGLLAGLVSPRPVPHPLLDAAAQDGSVVRFTGRLAEPIARHLAPPRWHGHALQARLNVVIDLDWVELNGAWHPVQARVTLGGEDVPLEVSVGDGVEGAARLVAPSAPQNPGEPDRRGALQRRGVAYVGSLQRGSLAALRLGTGFARSAERFRGEYAAFVSNRLQDPDRTALVAALAVGDRGGVSPDLTQAFNASGLAHVLSISGLHLTVAVLALAWLLRRLFGLSKHISDHIAPKKLAALVTLPATLFYVQATGAPPPAVRAGLGTGLALLGRVLGRDTDGLNTLGWTLALVTALDAPCLYEPSTQLSFLGVLGLITLTSRLRELIPLKRPDTEARGWRRRWQDAREGLLMGLLGSLAATLATAPVTAWYFERTSLVAALANLVAWPASTLIVPAGALSAIVYFFHPPLAGPLVDIAGWCAQGLCLAAHFFGDWPLASINVAPPSTIGLICYTALLIGIVNAPRWPRLIWLPLASTGLSGLVVLAWPTRPATGQLELTFLSVGQGDAAFLRFPNGSTMLVDGGGEASLRYDPGQRVVAPFLRSQGVHRLDYVVASHPHPDHIAGLPAIFERFAVGEYWHDGENAVEGPAAELAALASAGGTTVRTFVQGLPAHCPALPALEETYPLVASLHVGDPRCRPAPPSLDIDGVTVQLLHPLNGPERSYYPEFGENDNSVVMRLVHGNIRILMPGDLEHEGEALLLASGHDLSADLIKAPHHGSRTSSTQAFIDQVRPRHVVFCVGRHNMFGFPKPEVVERYARAGCQRYRTDEGAVTFVSDGQQLTVKRFLNRPETE